jgi:hypothetical protein
MTPALQVWSRLLLAMLVMQPTAGPQILQDYENAFRPAKMTMDTWDSEELHLGLCELYDIEQVSLPAQFET